MIYALLGYDLDRSLDELAAPEKQALHRKHATLREAASAGLTMIGHYRFRPARQATTVRFGAGELTTSQGAASEASETLRSLYLVEADDLDAAVALAGRLPATGAGATIEIWPLTEPRSH